MAEVPGQGAGRGDAEPRSHPVPDLGYFTQQPATSTAPAQLGAGDAAGSPPPHAAPPRSAPPARGASPWLVVGAVGAALVLVLAVFVGRFAWQQFVKAPVLPDTLMGMPRVGGAGIDEQMDALRAEVGQELTAGSDARVGLYTDGQGTGYIVMALRGGARPGDDEPSDMSGWTESQQDGATCWSQSATVPGGVAVSYCVRGFFRRSVAVFGIGTTPPDPFVVARATREAWDAQ